MTDERKEFDLIRCLFAPLAAHRPEALGLLDDAAIIEPDSGQGIAITTDCLVAGVHFFASDPPDSIAARSLRVNLSDLAAMGAVPDSYTLAIAIPENCDNAWLRAFADQLRRDQEQYEIDLIGGDTVSTPGPLTITITALGRLPVGQGVRRSSAVVGDDIYVSGTIGDACLGLSALQKGGDEFDQTTAEYLIDRFRFPSPRTQLGPQLLGKASAMADVSDGLIADLGHICSASGVGADIRLDQIPISDDARRVTGGKQESIMALLGGGDDYELVFTASRDIRSEVQAVGEKCQVAITRIGHICEAKSEQVSLLDEAGEILPISSTGGYEHQW